METATSADGTVITFEQFGEGLPVVIVGGAFSTAADGGALAAALVGVGFRAVTVDRRGRGSSGDKRGSTPADEADDITAVIEAIGGNAIVVGHSSGAILALFAASRGASIRALFLSEPPFHFDIGDPKPPLADRLQRLVDEGQSDEAVVTFQLEGVGLPRERVESIRQSEMFAGLVAIAQSTVYDARLAAELSTPTPEMLSVSQPVTILRGAQTFPILITAADRLAEEMDDAELVVVPESVMHRLDPAATARIVLRASDDAGARSRQPE